MFPLSLPPSHYRLIERTYGTRQRRPLSRQASLMKWERIASSNMTGSELDLEMHYDNFNKTKVQAGDNADDAKQTFV